ncbi:hypothetical protein P3T18_002739 [Paraburkholderia sp. GAS199]|uniref:DUF4148 domain-containing protein n=1 Tax=Paraburkholderia sp. GAS199 TaxID=3035126 RepID=UPI003D19AE44
MKPTLLNRLAARAISAALAAGAALFVISTGAHAQASSGPGAHPLTRAEVRHELEELEAAGYNPSQGDDSSYPVDIQEAEQKVAAMHAGQAHASNENQPAMQTMPMH